jgi:protein disulfide-isomerase-like protein
MDRRSWLQSVSSAILLVLVLHVNSARAGMYGSNVVELTSDNFKKLVIDSSSTWLVKFYAPWCGHCQQSAPALSKAAKKLDGVANLGVVNGDEQKELNSKFGIRGFPTIKVFKGEGKKERRPTDFSGERTASAFMEHVKYVMPSFIARIKESGLEAYFRDEAALPHVVLFTDKKATSPLYKGMSAEFRKRISFGEVRKAEAGGLLKKFGVDSFPKLIAFKAGESDPQSAVVHAGTMNPGSLRKFLTSVASGTEPEIGEETAHAEKVSEPVFSQPKAFDANVVEIVSADMYKSECGARADGRMCGLAFLPGGKANKLADELTSVAQKFQFDNMAFGVVDTTSADNGGAALAAVFGIQDPAKGGFVYVRSRKSKFAILGEDVELSAGSITSFLDRVVGGDARYKNIAADMPVWPGPAGVNVSESEKTNANANEADAHGGSEKPTLEEETTEGRCGLDPPADGSSCGSDAGREAKVEL